MHHRRNAHRPNPPAASSVVEVVRRDDGHWYRNTLGHLIGPYSTQKRALGEGAMALARVLHPGAPASEIARLAKDLLAEDRARPFVRRFTDGWRVWNPRTESFVGNGPGRPFATAGEAEYRRRALAGEPADDGPMFRRAEAAEAPSRAAPQLDLFGPRRNPAERVVPEKVRARLREGLRLVVEGRAGKGLRGQTVREAEAMAHGDPVPVDKVKRMAAWFRRHRVDKRPGWAERKTPGYVAWLLWGGDEGWAWAERERAALVRKGVLPPLKPRSNPGIFSPLRNDHGELVTYRPEGEVVVVRFSTPGVGAADREMDREGAVAHRAKLLRMGYRPNGNRARSA